MNRLIFFVLLVTCLKSSAQTTDTSFVSFWKSFQKDVIDKNYNGLTEKTVFPLKGSSIKYEKPDFQKAFSKFLTEEITIYIGGQPLTKIDRYSYLKTYKLKTKEPANKTRYIVEMTFEKLDNQWVLTKIDDIPHN